jgi:hypothetical protein
VSLLSIMMPTRNRTALFERALGLEPTALVDYLNRAIELATGEWIHQLHDDYLSPDAGARYWT